MVTSQLNISVLLARAANSRRNRFDKVLEWGGDKNLQGMLVYLAFLESAYLDAFEESLTLVFKGVEDKLNFSQDTIRLLAKSRLRGTRFDREMYFSHSADYIKEDLFDVASYSDADEHFISFLPAEDEGTDQSKIKGALDEITDRDQVQSFFSAWERSYHTFILQYMHLALEAEQNAPYACLDAWVSKIQREERGQNEHNFWNKLESPQEVVKAFLELDKKVLSSHCSPGI